MSKSLGNGIEPQAVSQKLGAEIIRLWVAASDYSGDLAGDDKILARVVDAYRRIRNTLRFLLANTSDFDAASRRRAARPRCWRSTAGRWRAPAQFQAEVLAHYEVYEFHPVVAKLQVFCSEDLGAFYLDVLKDRLYTTAPKSLARRSAQTALWQITHAMLRWMAPFLSFTAEEAWAVFAPGQRHRSSSRPTGRCRRAGRGAAGASGRACARCATLVNKEIEAVRAAGGVGSSLQAERDDRRAAGRPCAAGLAGRRPEVRAHHLGGDAAGRRRAGGRRCTPVDAPPSASAAGTGATTSATTRRTRRSAAAAPATCTAPAKRARWPEHGRAERRRRAEPGPVARPGALIVILARPVHQDADPRLLPARRQPHRHRRSSTSCACTTPARRSPSWPAPRAGSAGSSSAWAWRPRASSSGCCAATPAQQLFCLALSLILGGALGNVIDRLLHGYVVDFLQFHFAVLEPLFPAATSPASTSPTAPSRSARSA